MTNKRMAKDFLTDVAEGRIEQAFDKYVDMTGRHHNIYTPAGFDELKKGMAENEAQFPNKKFEIQHIAEDGDIVMVHSKIILSPEFPVMAVLHVLKFRDDKIVEMWDMGDQEPKDMPNADGMF